MVPSWLLDEVSQQLESEAERQQIHQLAFAANQHRWPEDPNLLDLYRLRDLVQDLTRTYSSFEELKQSLRLALNQAPHSKAFIPAARTLLKITRQAYQGDSSAAAMPSDDSLGNFNPAEAQHSPFETRTSNANDAVISKALPPLPYDDIAATLEQSPSATRIKKLLYAVCSGEWSNDPVMLGRFRLTNLLTQLHKMSADEEALHNALRNVVVTLNRQMEYELVAQLIQRECHRLYAPLEHISNRQQAAESSLSSSPTYEEAQFSPAPEISPAPNNGVEPVPLGFYDDDAPEPTGMLVPMGQMVSPTDHFGANQPETHNSVDDLPAELESPENQLSSPYSDATPVVSLENPASSTAGTAAWVNHSEATEQAVATEEPQASIANDSSFEQQPQTLDWQNLAEVRVELMRYANPLRVKVLMFSLLYYPFDFNAGTDWSKLQTETLSDLILRLMEQFTSYSSLDEQLNLMAAQLMPTDEYGSAAGAIARAIRPFYL